MLAISRQHDNAYDAQKKRIVGIAAAMLWSAITLLPAVAYAQVIGPTDLGQNLPTAIPFVYNSVTGYAAPWLSNVTLMANTLFMFLFTIELFLFGLQAILFKKANHLGDLFSGTALKLLGCSFFLFLINGVPLFPSLLPLVTQSMGKLGQLVVGTTTSMNTLLNTGNSAAITFLNTADILHAYDVFNAAHLGLLATNGGQVGLGVTAAFGNVIDECVLTGMALIIVAGMAAVFMSWVAITMEAVIVMSGGIIFLGFAGTRFTMPFAQGYLRYVVAVGAKLLVFWLVVTMENLIMGNGTKTVQTILANLSQIVALGRVPLHGAQAGNPGCNPFDFPKTGIICPIITPPNLQPTPLMADLLPFTYVAFEFLLMGFFAYAIPLFAGRFLSGAALMWRNLDDTDTTHPVSINEFRENISTLLSMRARHTLEARTKVDASPAAHSGASGFTTDVVSSPVNTIFAESANLGSSMAANPLLSQNVAFKSMSPSVTAGTFMALHPRNAVERASVSTSTPIVGSASEPSIDGVGRRAATGDPSERTPLEPSVSPSTSAATAQPWTWSTAVTQGRVEFTSTEIANMQPVQFYRAFRGVDFRGLTQAQTDAIRGREDLRKIAGLLAHDFQAEPSGGARGVQERV